MIAAIIFLTQFGLTLIFEEPNFENSQRNSLSASDDTSKYLQIIMRFLSAESSKLI